MEKKYIMVYSRAENSYILAEKGEGDWYEVIASGLSYNVARAAIISGGR